MLQGDDRFEPLRQPLRRGCPAQLQGPASFLPWLLEPPRGGNGGETGRLFRLLRRGNRHRRLTDFEAQGQQVSLLLTGCERHKCFKDEGLPLAQVLHPNAVRANLLQAQLVLGNIRIGDGQPSHAGTVGAATQLDGAGCMLQPLPLALVGRLDVQHAGTCLDAILRFSRRAVQSAAGDGPFIPGQPVSPCLR